MSQSSTFVLSDWTSRYIWISGFRVTGHRGIPRSRVTADIEVYLGLGWLDTRGRPLYLFSVESLRCVERLDDGRRVSDDQRITDGATEHADHGQPDVRQALRWIATVTNTQHVWQGLEQRPRVLLRPVGPLHSRQQTITIISQSKINS